MCPNVIVDFCGAFLFLIGISVYPSLRQQPRCGELPQSGKTGYYHDLIMKLRTLGREDFRADGLINVPSVHGVPTV